MIRLSPRRAPDLRDDALASARSSRTSSSTSAAGRPRRRLAKTENTRAAYKLEQIANALPTKRAGHPSTVVFLTADAFGILPPIARLTRDQALFYFLSGFTAKLAGTEIGVTEPQPTFSACFGAPFLPQPPAVYARMLGEARRARRHGLARQHGLDGRAVRRGRAHADQGHARVAPAALSGELDDVDYRDDPVFGFEVPVSVPGVVAGLLDPARPGATRGVRREGRDLARRFRENFEQKFAARQAPRWRPPAPRT